MRTMGLLLSTEACQQEKLRSKTSLPMAQCERPAGTARCSRGFSRMLKSQVCGRVLPHYARPETALLVTEVCDTVTRRHYLHPLPPRPPPSLPLQGLRPLGHTHCRISQNRGGGTHVFLAPTWPARTRVMPCALSAPIYGINTETASSRCMACASACA